MTQLVSHQNVCIECGGIGPCACLVGTDHYCFECARRRQLRRRQEEEAAAQVAKKPPSPRQSAHEPTVQKTKQEVPLPIR
jgi:hypothetical protein